jgi:hypothetical protein
MASLTKEEIVVGQERPPRAEAPPGGGLPDWARGLEEDGRTLLRARTEAERQRWRQAGYLAAVVVNAVLLVIAHGLLRWSIPFLTPAWADVLWAIDLALVGAIVANAVFVTYEEPWFRDLAHIALTALSLVAWHTLVQVFPFEFGDAGVNEFARLTGLLVIMALAVALFVQAIVWIVAQARRALR